uniref:Uncharacterized protein n=1 Tax=Setaria viridis TaxID=4556 RepID=A0A4U6W469_SETVI|nr:hypothetical protein SEVIR_1G031200v2 [Setaria viridis]
MNFIFIGGEGEEEKVFFPHVTDARGPRLHPSKLQLQNPALQKDSGSFGCLTGSFAP